MNKEQAIEFYTEYNKKCNAYNLALTTMYFDMHTIAPIKGSDYRIDMMSLLSGELFDYQTSKENIDKLNEISKLDLGELYNKEVAHVLKEVNKTALLPKEFYMKMQTTYSKGQVNWKKAKDAKDYSLFKDTLKEIVEVTKEAYRYYNKSDNLYNDMLDDYEQGMTIKEYDHFFNTIKEQLVPVVKAVVNAKQIDDSLMYHYYNPKKQEEFMHVLLDYMKYDKDESYLTTTEHPFTCDFSLHDVRITTKYVENALASSIFSVIHEYGHALYALQVDDKLEGLQIGRCMSSGMHESQSRFLENYIGRNNSYWTLNYPKLQNIFKEELKNITLDEFMKMINASKPSLIRVEADELTYPLHILIRYELEKDMINGEVDYDKLDEIWANKYEEYLGIRPENPSVGILQDIHWSEGMLGYFPTYALGSAFGAQFFNTMKKQINIDEALHNGQFEIIRNWLKENIHQYGAILSADEILQKVTGEPFNPQYYVDYLKEKYTKLYNL